MTDYLTEALIGADYLEKEGQATCEAVRKLVEQVQNPTPLQTIRNIIRNHKIVRGEPPHEIEVSHEFYNQLRDELFIMETIHRRIPSTTMRVDGVTITRHESISQRVMRVMSDIALDPLTYIQTPAQEQK